ncbi:pPIWI-associating nuclease domain-containing protein [Spirosoma litoris]
MEIRQQYLQRYLHDIAIDQLVADYQAKGYQVTKEEKVGNYQADLVAKREGEVVVVEVKTGRMTAQKRRELTEIGDYVRTQKNYKFLVVIATPPKPKKIDIPNLDQLLLDHLINHFPSQLDELSSHTRIIDVSDVVVNELTVSEDGSITVKGNGIVEVELHYGSKDDQTETDDTFPFDFEVILKYNLNHELFLSGVDKIDVDTSSFYE